MTTKPEFTPKELAQCATRELLYRVRVYARLVANEKMTADNAQREIAMMRAIADIMCKRAVQAEQLELNLEEGTGK